MQTPIGKVLSCCQRSDIWATSPWCPARLNAGTPLTKGLWDYNSNIVQNCLAPTWKINIKTGYNFAHAVVACAYLSPDMIITNKIKAMRILTRFQLWAHKPSVKCLPGILIRGNLAGFPVFIFTEEIGSSGSWQLGFSHRRCKVAGGRLAYSDIKTEWGIEHIIISIARKVNVASAVQ